MQDHDISAKCLFVYQKCHVKLHVFKCEDLTNKKKITLRTIQPKCIFIQFRILLALKLNQIYLVNIHFAMTTGNISNAVFIQLRIFKITKK